MQSQLDGLLNQFTYLQRKRHVYNTTQILVDQRLILPHHSSGFRELYRGRGDSDTAKQEKNFQDLLKPVFYGIASFLRGSAEYYER